LAAFRLVAYLAVASRALASWLASPLRALVVAYTVLAVAALVYLVLAVSLRRRGR
jgi:hypothetical protein